MSGGEWGWGGEEAGEEAGEVGEGVASWLSEVEAARRVHALAGPVVSEIRRRVRDATGGLTLSARRRTALCFSTSDECLVAPFDQAGIAPNFLLAKMGADVNKPDGQHTVSPTVEAVLAFLSATPTRKAIPPSAAHHEAAPRSCATARLYLGISRLHLGYISATPRGQVPFLGRVAEKLLQEVLGVRTGGELLEAAAEAHCLFSRGRAPRYSRDIAEI